MRWPWMMTRKQWNEAMVRAVPVRADWAPCPPLRSRARVPEPAVGRIELCQMAEDLATESSAYLAGTYAESLAARARVVPGWAWTNLLAHGTLENLRLEAQALDEGRLRTRVWLAARGYLAAEIVERVDRGASLAALQHRVLLPLERALIARPPGRSGLGLQVTEWVAMVRAGLADHDAPAVRGGTEPCG